MQMVLPGLVERGRAAVEEVVEAEHRLTGMPLGPEVMGLTVASTCERTSSKEEEPPFPPPYLEAYLLCPGLTI